MAGLFRVAPGAPGWRPFAALLGVLQLVSAGCTDPLVDPATVTGPRIVGARVRATSDPRNAEPAGGEVARLEWLVVSDVAASREATAAFCSAEPSRLGAPRCASASFEERRVALSFGAPLALDFVLPAALAPGARWLAWLGFCEGGDESAAPSFDAAQGAFSCPAGASARSAFYRGRVPQTRPNQNPTLADDELWLDGELWARSDPELGPGAPCSADLAPRAQPGDELEIVFVLGGEDREALPEVEQQYAAHLRESLVYTHVASVPGLSRAFSAIDHDAERAEFSVRFAPPAHLAPAPAGEAVSFHLLVRDERGGVDWTRRDLCLVPITSGGT